MPWEVKKQSGKFCVVKKGESSPIAGGCHPTRAEANKQIAALYAAEPPAGKSMPLADMLLEAAMKAGARHSQSDMAHIQAAHDHLKDCGADCAANDNGAAGKSIAMKCMGMDAGGVMNYAQGEAMDVGTAASALQSLSYLAQHEAGEDDEDPLDVQQLATVMRGLLQFIAGEIDEMEGGLGTEAPGKSIDPEKTLVAFGDTVKALGGGKIGGYLIRYSDWKHPDLSAKRDYFDSKTYFGARAGDGVDTLIHHGQLLKDPNTPAEARVLNKVTDLILPAVKTKQDDLGIFAETVLDLADEYQALVYQLAEAGKLSWSSGVPVHAIKRTKMPNNTNHVDRWLIGEASLTPTPADPYNGQVLPMKSLFLAAPGQADPDGSAAKKGDGNSAIPDDLLELGMMVKRKAGVLL